MLKKSNLYMLFVLVALLALSIPSTFAQEDQEIIYVDPEAGKMGEEDKETSSIIITYPSIQEAIDAASPGALISVPAGTYKEQLVIDKNLTLVGPNHDKAGYAQDRGAEAIIEFPDPENLGNGTHILVNILASGVTIKGFSINDNVSTDFTYDGTWPPPKLVRGVNSFESNTVIENNRFSGFNYVAVIMTQASASNTNTTVAKVNNLTRNNYFYGGTVFNSIYYQASAGVIEGNIVESSGSGIQIQPYFTNASGTVSNNDLSVYGSGLYYNYANWTIDENALWTFSENNVNVAAGIPEWSKLTWDANPRAFQGIRVETYLQNASTGTLNKEPKANFINNTTNGDGASSDGGWLAVEGMYFRNVKGNSTTNVQNITFYDNIFYDVEVGVQFDKATDLEYDLAELYENGNTYPAGMVVIHPYQIGFTLVKNITKNLGYHTIQDAIDDADPNDTIEVNEGIYEEQLFINKSLVLSGQAGAVIQAPPAAGRTTYTIPESGRTFDPIVFADGDAAAISVTIEGFEISGQNDPGSNTYAGILLRQVNPGVLSNNNIHSLMASHETLGISVYGEDTRVTVTGNSIAGFRRNALSVIDAVEADVIGNTIIGMGYTTGWAQNGIQLWGVGSGNVSGNTLSEIGWIWESGTRWSSTGILIWECDGTTVIHDNDLTNVQVAIRSSYSNFEATENTVEMQDSGALEHSGGIWGNPQGRPEAIASPFDAQETSAEKQKHLATTGNGPIELTFKYENNVVTGDSSANGWGIAIWPYDGYLINATATGNTVSDWEIGFDIWGTADDFEAVLRKNRIVDNQLGLWNWTVVEVDARENWWGDASGPYHDDTNLDGLGDVVSNYVLFDPWYVDEEMTRLSDEVEPFEPYTRIGVHRDNTFYLDADGDLDFDSTIDRYSNFGTPDDTPVIGDWNGDGYDQIGIRRDNTFYLDYNDNMAWEFPGDIFGNFGVATDTILIGDWNGDGKDQVGVWREGTFFLDYDGNLDFDPAVDKMYTFGASDDSPIIGDWNGDGKDQIGVRYGSIFNLDYDGDGAWDETHDRMGSFGLATDTILIGDWNGDGKDQIGVHRDNTFYLDYDGDLNFDADIDKFANFGTPDDIPIIGDWNGDGKDQIGIRRGPTYYLDYNGNMEWNWPGDIFGNFGIETDTILIGYWGP